MQQTFTVPEISCEHCKGAIEGALSPVPGVARAEVDVEAQTVDVDYDPTTVPEGVLRQAIEEAGYTVAG